MDALRNHSCSTSRSPRSFSRIHTHAITAFFIAFFLIVTQTHAALLYVTPSATSINKNATFTVSVRTDTEGQSINVAEATISFPSDKLRIVKATPGSTFSIQTPGSPKITKNQVYFSAGIPTPGYSGKSGVLGTITFQAIAPGPAMLKVDTGKVLLNDGKATDALVQRASATINVTEAVPVPTPEPTPVEEVTPVEEIPQEQAVMPTLPAPTEVAVQESQGTQDVVTTITIRVKDLIKVIYILAILLGIAIVIALYLFISNINLRHKNKELKERLNI